MSKVVYEGKIYSAFDGFSGDKLFKMANGTYWIQSQYEYWYHYAYMPMAVITEENGQYLLTVAGKSISVRRISDVIESQIDGEFKGWGGSTSYKLTNCQVWQQSEYKYEYKYAYCPKVIIYNGSGSYIMSVDGTTAKVRKVN